MTFSSLFIALSLRKNINDIIHSEKCLVIILNTFNFVKKSPPLPLLNLFPLFSVRYTTLLHWKLAKLSELSLIMICSEYRQFTHFTLSTRRCLSSSEKWRLEPKENLFCSCKRQQECSYNYLGIFTSFFKQ